MQYFLCPEAVYKLVWPGGEGNIKLSKKSAALDLLFLNSCDNNDFISSGGGNSGTAESNIPFNKTAGTYYIVVDGWAQAKGTYDLLVSQKGVTPTNGVSLNASMRAYPNPFNDVLNVEIILDKSSSLEYEIIDAFGRTCRKGISKAITNKHTITIRDMGYRGIMFVRVKSNSSRGFIRVIKE